MAGAEEYTDCASADVKKTLNKCPGYDTEQSDGEVPVILELLGLLLYFDLLTRPKMPFKVMHRKEMTHSGGSYERKSRGRKLADEMGRGKKDPIILS